MMHRVQPSSQVLLQPLVSHVCLMRPWHVISSLLCPLLLWYTNTVLPAQTDIDCEWNRLPPDAVSKSDNLVQDHLSHVRHTLNHLKAEVERRGALRLVRSVVPDMKVPVLQCLLNRYPRRRVEGQHTVE